METTSRYEALNALQNQKLDLIKQKNSLGQQAKEKKKEIVQLERQLEDKKADLADFENTISEKTANTDALIEAVNTGIEQFTSLSQKTQK